MEAYAQILTYIIPGFVLLIIIEAIIARIMGMKVYRSMDTISSLSSGLTNTLKSLLGLSIVIVSYTWMVDHLALFEIKSSLLLYFMTFIGLDFAGYWSHRFNHVVNIMWNRHIIHHSSEEYNLACALRQTVSGFVGVYFFLYVPMAFIGIPAEVIAVAAPIHLFSQFWYHTRVIKRMGFLEHILVTPSHHRVHHAINPIYIDKNYSEVLIIWDKWFGTFQEELDTEPPVYGTKMPAETWNPLIINFMHLWLLMKDAWLTKSYRDKLRIWFMPTGWRPADVTEKYPLTMTEDVHARKKYQTSASRALHIWSWTQLIAHNLLIYYILSFIVTFDFTAIVLYVTFVMVSIFSATTLMDRHSLALPVEVIKAGLGLTLIWWYQGWFDLDVVIPYATWMMCLYLLASLIMTIYFTKYDKINEANSTLTAV